MPAYLQLPVVQGGTRFGPFDGGVVQIGSSNNHCQVILSTPGIDPVHAMVVLMGDGSFTVQPSRPGIALELVRRGQTQRWPVEAPTTAQSGDQLMVGAAGITFTLQWENTATAAASKPKNSGPGMLNRGGKPLSAGIANEMQRQAMAKMLGRPGPMRDLYHAYNRFRSGAMNNPRFIVSLVLSVLAGGLTVATGCLGLMAAVVTKVLGG